MRPLTFRFILLLPACWCIQQTDWQPIAISGIFETPSKHYQEAAPSYGHVIPSDYSDLHQEDSEQCQMYKVGFTQDLYFQYIHYKINMPQMKEFTLCFWTKFTNHTNDHPLFSYAVDNQPRAIYSWVSNTERSSYFSLSISGHTFYRLNYPLRLNRWYHTCQSWNGKTGEWQIWVNAERVGRGFHNRLVGHTIPSGGIAITGQEQTQLGGGFQEGHGAPKGSGGMLGEVTMFQLYKVALTAGKAHKDHKHHHAHRYDHDGTPITTPPPTTPPPRPTLPTHPLLTSGQLNPALRLNLAGGSNQQPQLIQGQSFATQYVNGQLVGNILSQQIQSGRGPQQFLLQQQQPPPQQQQQPPPQQQQQFFVQPQQEPQQLQALIAGDGGSISSQSLTFGNTPLVGSTVVHTNVQYIDDTPEDHQLYKRQNPEEKTEFGARIKRAKHSKRELFIAGGTILEDGQIGGHFSQTLLDGLAGIGENQPILQEQQEKDEREPAEAEVKAVMNVCSGCDQEPFEKALVFGWRTVPKKLYSGAYYIQAAPQCRAF